MPEMRGVQRAAEGFPRRWQRCGAIRGRRRHSWRSDRAQVAAAGRRSQKHRRRQQVIAAAAVPGTASHQPPRRDWDLALQEFCRGCLSQDAYEGQVGSRRSAYWFPNGLLSGTSALRNAVSLSQTSRIAPSDAATSGSFSIITLYPLEFRQ